MAGKAVLITGASIGIGKATAAGLARHGARVGIVGRDHGRTTAAAADVSATSGQRRARDVLLVRQHGDTLEERRARLRCMLAPARRAGVDTEAVTMPEHPNVAIVRRLGEAFLSHDMAQLAAAAQALMSDDIVWHEIGRAEPRRGRAELRAGLSDIDYTITGTTHDILANDDHAVVLGDATATRGGRTLHYRVAEIYHIRDGTITERWAFSDDTAASTAFFAERTRPAGSTPPLSPLPRPVPRHAEQRPSFAIPGQPSTTTSRRWSSAGSAGRPTPKVGGSNCGGPRIASELTPGWTASAATMSTSRCLLPRCSPSARSHGCPWHARAR